MKRILCCLGMCAAFAAHGQTIIPTPLVGKPAGAVPLSLRIVGRDRHTKTVEWVGAKTNAGQIERAPAN